jgi:hypothetical protein
VSFGLFVGAWTVALVVWQWPAPAVEAAPLGVLVAVVVWAAAEQRPMLVDRALSHRLHFLVAGFALVPMVVVLWAVENDIVTDALAAPAFGIAITGLAATVAATTRRARVVCEREQAHLTLTAREPRRRRAVLMFLAMVATYAVLDLVTGDVLSPGAFVGLAIGVCVGTLFIGRQSVELVAFDSGLVVRPSRQFGTNLLPWSRVGRVTLDGDTLRVHQRLPWPLVYTVDLGDRDDREAVVTTLRARVG